MPAHYLATYLSGDASIKHCFISQIILLGLWLVLGVLYLTLIGPMVSIALYVISVNIISFITGAIAIYGASLTSHSISQSFHQASWKFLLRFINFLFLFAGIVIVILVASGEVSWMVYFYQGIYR